MSQIDPEMAARAYLNLGSWPRVYKAFNTNADEKEAKEKGGDLGERKDVQRALDSLRRRQVYVRKSKDDLLLALEDVIEEADKDSDKIGAIKLYSELAGYKREEKREHVPVITITTEEFKIAERELKSLPGTTEDAGAK